MRTAALFAGKAAASASRLLKRGSGTTYPGVLAERLEPNLIRDLARSLPRGAVVVSGTNGKTTTSKMLADALAEAGVRLVRNESGSNLRQGIASTFVSAADLISGRLRGEMAVLEVDEATTRSIVPLIQPRVFCVTNLFRDQLDRYGDLDAIGARLGEAVASVPDSTLLLNADDPLVVALAKRHVGKVAYFGLDTTGLSAVGASERGVNVTGCPQCGEPTRLSAATYDHLGAWQCDSCGEHRPIPEFTASEVRLAAGGSAFTFTAHGQSVRIVLPVGGTYNVYNAVAAASCAVVCGLPLSGIARSLAAFEPAFGRSEDLTIGDHTVQLLLAKNPTGAEQAIVSALADGAPKALGFALNDNAADGTDVSWIWDIDFEAYDLSAVPFVVSGSRAEELAVRLKYAGTGGRVDVCKDPAGAVRLLAELVPSGGSAHMLATYTAMLGIRNDLVSNAGRFGALGRDLRHDLQH